MPRFRKSLPAALVALLACSATHLAAQAALRLEDQVVGIDDTISTERFGSWIDAAGDYMIVSGAPSLVRGSSRGSVFPYLEIHQRSGSGWVNVASREETSNSGARQFPVATDGQYFAKALQDNSGSSFIVQRMLLDPGLWVTAFTAGGTQSRPFDLQIRGDIIAVSWIEIDAVLLTTVTKFAIYERLGGIWQQVQSNQFTGSTPLDLSLNLVGDRLAVGVPHLEQVYVYKRSAPGNWFDPPEIINSPSSSDVAFGAAVALRAGVLAVGAPETDICLFPGTCNEDAGQVRFYAELLDGTYDPRGVLLSILDVPPQDGLVGFSVALSDDAQRVAAGAPLWPFTGSSRGGVTARGAVFVADAPLTGNTWRNRVVHRHEADDISNLGLSVAMAGRSIASGAPNFEWQGRTTGAAVLWREAEVFADDFESGNLDAWSTSVP